MEMALMNRLCCQLLVDKFFIQILYGRQISLLYVSMFLFSYVSCVVGCPYEGDIDPTKVAKVGSFTISLCNFGKGC